ncbi:hypothetical protein BJL95_03750 [Methylomonas sp. LWB]|nr:hypothetical protein BJL95_03750 [Methylomonas sp. LWB]
MNSANAPPLSVALAVMLRLASVLLSLAVVVALSTGGFSSAPTAPSFQLVDQRPAAEREGFPYPNSSFRYTMHGDRSLEVDRLQLLQVRLMERFQHELAGKQ